MTTILAGRAQYLAAGSPWDQPCGSLALGRYRHWRV